MPKPRLHVKPDGDVWVVQKEGSKRASAVVKTKREALERAADIADRQNIAVVVHGANGRIQRVYQPGDTDDSGDCFLTTACVRHFGLPDSCYELTTLRAFRDRHMIQTPEGLTLVSQYYVQAPSLVRKIDQRTDKSEVYSEVMKRIRQACASIEKGRMSEAQSIYTEAIAWLVSLTN